MRTKYFFGFIISFVAGVAIESILDFGYSLALLCAFLSIFIYLTPRVRGWGENVLFVSFVFLGLSLGIFRVDVSSMNTAEHKLDAIVGKTLEVTGIIIDEPDVREEYTNVVLEAEVTPGKSLVLVRVPAYPKLSYGDEVVAKGKIIIPKNLPAKDNLRAFDYRAYLAKDGIYYQMYFPKITVVSHNKGNVVRENLFDFKNVLIKNISENIPEPEASLATGITLGAKQSLGSDLIAKFRDTGVAHIVVLSGYNIAVVLGIISRLVVFMPFSIRLIMSAIGIVLFAVMVGGGATVVRATAMALVVILARVFGREGDALRVLVLVGGLMVLLNPMILLNDVSFQLSFSATLAIVVLVPIIEKYFLFISNRMLREIVITTLATQIFVLPLILYHMGSVSLIGFIANIFVLPVVPIAMLIVALVSFFAWVPLIGTIFAFLAYLILKYIFLAVEFFASIPFASLSGISFSLWMLMLTYTLFSLFFYFFYEGRAVDVAIEK